MENENCLWRLETEYGDLVVQCTFLVPIFLWSNIPLVQEYANERGVRIVGDMPIYVGGQSADVWANRCSC